MFFKVVALLYLASTVYCVTFHIQNNSPSTPVFVQILGTEYPDPFTLQGGQIANFTFNEPWSGRFWGRVDCYSVQDCDAAGPVPASLTEMTVGYGPVFYDLSLVDGFNIKLSIEPVGGHGDGSKYSCNKIDCSYPILNDCPDELKFFNATGDLVTCQSPCSRTFEDDSFCCGRDIGTINCRPSELELELLEFFSQRCPDAYSFNYDDVSNTSICDADEYIITFL